MLFYRNRIIALSLALIVIRVSAAESADNPMPYAPLPEAISSFGATCTGGAIYVFGGHMGRVPGNSLDGLSPHFCRLQLSVPAAGWEDLPMQASSQSPGLVAWNGKVYRVGGLSFHNRAGEETEFHSLDLFSEFDPGTKTWADLPAMPAPRSSLDAAVVDGKVYVIGGWNLQGASAQSGAWHDDALVFDLTQLEQESTKESAQWAIIATPPFQTRALAVAGFDHKLYVLGGMKSNNQTTREVYVYNPGDNSWTQGPELKTSGSFGGFAIAAFAEGDHLYYCGGDGTIYVLSEARDDWQPVERLLFSRMFHRLVPAGEGRMAVIGGVSGGNYLSSVEVVNVRAVDPLRIKTAEWSIPFDGEARHSQTLLVNGASLYAFGGNKSPEAHDFSKEAFVNQAFRFDLAARTVERLPDMPLAMQSGGAFVAGSRIDQSIYVIGGLSFEHERFGSSDLIQQYRMRSKAWSEETQRLPSSRAMFGAAIQGGSAWIFGGSRVKTAMPGLAGETWEWNVTNDEPPTVANELEIPDKRRSFGGAVLDEHFYAVGGLGEDSQIVAAVNVFDFKNRRWSVIGGPALARVFPSVAASGGRLYVSGGFTNSNGHFSPAKTIEVYDPKTSTWTTALAEIDLPLAEMTMLEYQDRLLFYTIDQVQPGRARFVLVDPTPTAVGFGAISNPVEERNAGSVMASRLMRLDKNQDGRLTAEEVPGRFQPIIARVDENQDGIATKEEIEAYIRREDESNRPTAGRSSSGARGGRDGGDRGAVRVLGENDADKDGKLTGEEIPARMRAHVESADKNQDGSIDSTELEELIRLSSIGRGKP